MRQVSFLRKPRSLVTILVAIVLFSVIIIFSYTSNNVEIDDSTLRYDRVNGLKVYTQSRLKADLIPESPESPESPEKTTALQVTRNSVPQTHVTAKDSTAQQSSHSYTIKTSSPSASTSEYINQPTAHKSLAPQCIDKNCLEYLSSLEKSAVSKCEKVTIHNFGVNSMQKGTCRFMSDNSRKAVALASPEGSGNTWVRALLEKATGICTGFCCCDHQLRVQGFVGEGVMSGKTLVVKTHIGFPQWIGSRKKLSWEGSYGSAVVLIRNPAKALIAEWNRRMTNKENEQKKGLTVDSHTHIVSKSEFETKEWREFTETYLEHWINRLDNWVFDNNDHAVHVLSYEDIKKDKVREIEKILDFLNYPYEHEELVVKLTEDLTVLQRQHGNNSDFQHYTPEQKQMITHTLETVMSKAEASGKAHLFHFQDYLHSLSDIN